MGHAPSITGHTKAIGLIGTPIAHSLSPALHTASFAQMGVDCVYLAFDVQPEQLEAAVRGMRELGFVGFNVTMPHKTVVARHLDELSDAAELMGAVNCVELAGGKAIGHNTDGAGFMRNLEENGVEVAGKKMTVVGAGGAGSAVFTQAALDGVAAIDVFNVRDPFFEGARERIARVSERTGCAMTLHDLGDASALRASVAESALFVNASRAGMAPLDDQCVLPEEFLHDGLVVADTVYNPRVTKLLAMAKDHGLKTVSGLGMMMWQAAIGEEIWTGKRMDIDFIEGLFFS